LNPAGFEPRAFGTSSLSHLDDSNQSATLNNVHNNLETKRMSAYNEYDQIIYFCINILYTCSLSYSYTYLMYKILPNLKLLPNSLEGTLHLLKVRVLKISD
jgi:hypothetical protein